MFKDISYLELWHPLCSAEQNQLEGINYEEHFEYEPVVQEMLLKDFLSRALVAL